MRTRMAQQHVVFLEGVVAMVRGMHVINTWQPNTNEGSQDGARAERHLTALTILHAPRAW